MKCLILFSVKNTIHIINLSSAALVQRMVKVKFQIEMFRYLKFTYFYLDGKSYDCNLLWYIRYVYYLAASKEKRASGRIHYLGRLGTL